MPYNFAPSPHFTSIWAHVGCSCSPFMPGSKLLNRALKQTDCRLHCTTTQTIFYRNKKWCTNVSSMADCKFQAQSASEEAPPPFTCFFMNSSKPCPRVWIVVLLIFLSTATFDLHAPLSQLHPHLNRHLNQHPQHHPHPHPHHHPLLNVCYCATAVPQSPPIQLCSCHFTFILWLLQFTI